MGCTSRFIYYFGLDTLTKSEFGNFLRISRFKSVLFQSWPVILQKCIPLCVLFYSCVYYKFGVTHDSWSSPHTYRSLGWDKDLVRLMEFSVFLEVRCNRWKCSLISSERYSALAGVHGEKMYRKPIRTAVECMKYLTSNFLVSSVAKPVAQESALERSNVLIRPSPRAPTVPRTRSHHGGSLATPRNVTSRAINP